MEQQQKKTGRTRREKVKNKVSRKSKGRGGGGAQVRRKQELKNVSTCTDQTSS